MKRFIFFDVMGPWFTLTHEKQDGLDWAYRMIGCDLVEIVRPKGLPEGYVLVIDEEGLLKECPMLNLYPSYLYGFHEHGQPIVGNAILMKEVAGCDGYKLEPLDDGEVDMMVKKITEEMPEAYRKITEYLRSK